MASSRASAPASRHDWGFKPSRRLRLSVALASAAILALLLAAPLVLPLRLAGLALWAGLSLHYLRRYRVPRVGALRRQGEDWFLLHGAAAEPVSLGGHWHRPWLALLRFERQDGRTLSVEVLPDMLSDADWRRLLWVLRGFE